MHRRVDFHNIHRNLGTPASNCIYRSNHYTIHSTNNLPRSFNAHTHGRFELHIRQSFTSFLKQIATNRVVTRSVLPWHSRLQSIRTNIAELFVGFPRICRLYFLRADA
jgi:hypothetical protein